eukprot:600531-Amphidinium_carterae.1
MGQIGTRPRQRTHPQPPAPHTGGEPPNREKSDDEHVPNGTTPGGESSVTVDPATKDISRPTSLDGTRSAGMDELIAQALRKAILTSAKAVDVVNAMVGDRLSYVRDAQSVLENSEELVARATSRKRKEQGALPEGQMIEIRKTEKGPTDEGPSKKYRFVLRSGLKEMNCVVCKFAIPGNGRTAIARTSCSIRHSNARCTEQ